MVSVVILAAGQGTRMCSNTPKVLHKICGKSMLEYVIDAALSVSSDIHIVLFHQQENIRESIQQAYPPYLLDKLNFHTQLHHKYPGTGGALIVENSNGDFITKELLALKGEKILILSGDTPLITTQDLQCLIQGNGNINIGIFQANNPEGYGRVIANHVKEEDSLLQEKILPIQDIIEQKDCTPNQAQISLVNGGIYCFSKDILARYITHLTPNNAQREYYLTDIIALAKADKVLILGHILDGNNLFGVNSKIDLAKAQDIMLDSLRLKAMRQGVTMRMPQTIYLDYDVVFEGECVLENGVCITGKTIIKDSVIKAHTVIEESEILSSDIGPNARIRPQCKIINSHIGNFVECKKANLTGIKAGHLSYLGDCEINERSNIGAGVITCNYDGKKKHKTFIGKNVFIGSNCQLIAPLEIQDNVLIGAGSTVTKNAKSGDLVIARQKQTNQENGFYRFFNKQ